MVTKYNALQMNHYSAPDEFGLNLQIKLLIFIIEHSVLLEN